METDTDSHRPLITDEEDEVEVYGRQYHSVQEQEEPPVEAPAAVSFLQAFCLPGVLPVSLYMTQGR